METLNLQIEEKLEDKEKFILTVDFFLNNVDDFEEKENVKRYWEKLKKDLNNSKVKAKTITENGQKILDYLITIEDGKAVSAKEIGEEIFMSPRAVGGSMRKLITDGYVSKTDSKPICYILTEKGKNLFKGETR